MNAVFKLMRWKECMADSVLNVVTLDSGTPHLGDVVVVERIDCIDLARYAENTSC